MNVEEIKSDVVKEERVETAGMDSRSLAANGKNKICW